MDSRQFSEKPLFLLGQSSPLRWAGSKKRLLRRLCERSPKKYIRYIEPFAGSAVLFYALRPRMAVLSDINADLIHFYRALRRAPIELHERVLRLDQSKETYLKVRASFPSTSGIERAGNFWFLNRCCFNGIYRTNRKGLFNVPFGSKLPPIPGVEEAIIWAKALHASDLICASYEAALSAADAGDFVYLDPPYARCQARDRGEYGPNALQPDGIDVVLEATRAASDRGAKILLSYNRDLRESLPGWRQEIINVRRDVSARALSRRTVTEYLFSNY